MGQNRTKLVAERPRSDSSRGADALIAIQAGLQVGRVCRRKLLAAGVTDAQIKSRVGSGRLVVEAPGVYAIDGATHGPRERLATALLYAGPGSLGSHLSSAAEWRFRLPSPIVVDITNARRLDSRPGIRLHHREIHPDEIRRVRGIPITSPSQTLFDLATVLGAKSLAKAANEAFVLCLVNLDDLTSTLERNAGRRGSQAFRRLLDRLDPEGRRVRSPLETLLHDFLRARGFPPWESNVRLRIGEETIEPDVLWREQRVIVEADGRDPHLAPLTFDSDRRRDRRCRVERWEPVRVTWADFDLRQDELDSDLRALLRI